MVAGVEAIEKEQWSNSRVMDNPVDDIDGTTCARALPNGSEHASIGVSFAVIDVQGQCAAKKESGPTGRTIRDCR